MYSPSNFHGFHRFHEIFYKLRKYISTVWKNEKFTVTQKKNSSNQLFISNLFSKTVTFTEFLPKMRVREFDRHSGVVISKISPPRLFCKNFVKVILSQKSYTVN